MTEIRFYHLTRTKLEAALPSLLEKALERNWRALVLTSSAERSESLAEILWTFRGEAFLPHGTARDGNPSDQPVWIAEKDENPNGAQVLFLTDGAKSEQIHAFDLVCELFDGNDDAALAGARKRWTEYKGAGHAVSYWKQEGRGWVKEA